MPRHVAILEKSEGETDKDPLRLGIAIARIIEETGVGDRVPSADGEMLEGTAQLDTHAGISGQKATDLQPPLDPLTGPELGVKIDEAGIEPLVHPRLITQLEVVVDCAFAHSLGLETNPPAAVVEKPKGLQPEPGIGPLEKTNGGPGLPGPGQLKMLLEGQLGQLRIGLPLVFDHVGAHRITFVTTPRQIIVLIEGDEFEDSGQPGAGPEPVTGGDFKRPLVFEKTGLVVQKGVKTRP